MSEALKRATERMGLGRMHSHVHDQFDRLWKGPGATMTRHDAYKWLAGEMGIDRNDCHIGKFTHAQCRQVLEILGAVARTEP